ncbi:MAG: transposase [Okeania sp. SIO2C9]|uniref:RNA-guided endonuclease TnpB family protein n=1 Tax=Okeania sp. SIO2C9 TaxID=2607791 RepID=UPI0013C09F88|nr:transposase [Okeania sp. SIO2C9]
MRPRDDASSLAERAPRDHKLARAISDANWSELVRQLEYKAEWYGRELIKIDRYFPSSKSCSNCGYVVEKLPLNIREWDCPECDSHHDRDINAAINILRMGTRGVRKTQAVRPRVAVRRKRSEPATTLVARERRPREGMLTKRGNAHARRLREEQCQSVERP